MTDAAFGVPNNSRHMDGVSSPAPVPPPPPAPGLPTPEQRRRVERQRRTRGWLVVALSVAAVLAVVTVVLVQQLGSAKTRSANAERQLRVTRASLHSAQSDLDEVKDRLSATSGQLSRLRHQVRKSVGSLTHPQFVVWNVPQSLDASHYLFGSIPDTFSWSLRLRSTGSPIKVLVMTDHDYACWFTGSCTAHWRYWGPSNNITATWDAGRGCSGYVFVITSTGSTTVVPTETITRDPAMHGTGTCRA
jgi:hypothetical protein